MTRFRFAIPLNIALIAAACSQGPEHEQTAAASGDAPAASPIPATLPPVKPGLWKTRMVSFDGGDEARASADHEDETNCIGPNASYLDAIQTDVPACKPSISKSGSTYYVDAKCENEGVVMAMRGSIAGDFLSVMTSDMELRLGAAGQPLETMRLKLESRYVGTCKSDDDAA